MGWGQYHVCLTTLWPLPIFPLAFPHIVLWLLGWVPTALARLGQAAPQPLDKWPMGSHHLAEHLPRDHLLTGV